MTTVRLRNAAAEGALAGLICAAADTLFAVLVPWLLRSVHEYHEFHWGFTALLMVLCPLLGGLLGATLTALTGGLLETMGGVLVIVAAFAAYVTFVPGLGAWKPILAAMAAVLAALLLLAAASPAWRIRLRFLTNAWTVSLLVIGVPAIVYDLLSAFGRMQRIIAALAYVAAILLLSFLFARRTGAGLFRRTVFAGALSVVILVAAALPKAQARIGTPAAASSLSNVARPNVILIVLDTVRADHLSLYGYGRRTTPNLEHFASGAVVYSRASAPADMTLPSHGSLFTGVYASRHGAHMSFENPKGRALETAYPTMAEILGKTGYRTAAVVANSGYLQQAFLFYRGFDHYDDRWPVAFLADTTGSWLRHEAYVVFGHALPVGEAVRVYRDAATITDEAMRLLDAGRGGRPLFLFLNYMDAHFPCAPPAPFNTLFPGRNPSFTPQRFSEIRDEVVEREAAVSAADRNHLVSQYDGGIAYMDAELARLFAHIEQRGLYDSSMIIVASDHGEAFGERKLIEHGGVSVYQEETWVPLLIKYPRAAHRGSFAQRVSLVDVLPTVLDVAGANTPAGIDGRSLLGTLPDDREIITESFVSPEFAGQNPRFNRDFHAVLSGPMKFISSTRGARELYDLDHDPLETTNLYAKDPGAARQLEAGLRQWLATAAAPAPSGTAPRIRLDALKSLGYVQ